MIKKVRKVRYIIKIVQSVRLASKPGGMVVVVYRAPLHVSSLVR